MSFSDISNIVSTINLKCPKYLIKNGNKAHSQGRDIFLATEIPLKMMKNTFYFTSKALFVLKIFKFLP